MYYIYILRSQKDGNLYIGQTENLEERLRYHNLGRVKSTKRRLPLELLHMEEFSSRSEAMRREKILKSIECRDFKRLLRDCSVG